MDLKARLRALESAAGRRQPQTQQSDTASASGATSSESALAFELGAHMLSPGLLYREERLSAAYRHGGFSLGEVLGIGAEIDLGHTDL